jgi:hypothetical protein
MTEGVHGKGALVKFGTRAKYGRYFVICCSEKKEQKAKFIPRNRNGKIQVAPMSRYYQ